MTIDAGHVGLVVGGKAQKIWPEATRWLPSAPQPGNGGEPSLTEAPWESRNPQALNRIEH